MISNSTRLSFARLVQGYSLYQQAQGCTNTTRDTAKRALASFAATLPTECLNDVSVISDEHVLIWAANMSEAQYAAATRDQRIAKVKAFFSWAVREGFILDNPTTELRRPRNNWQPTPFTADALKAIFEEAKRTRQPDRDYAIVSLLADTGIRASELCGAPLAAVSLDSGQLRVVGKGGAERVVIFGKRTKAALWRWLMCRPAQDTDNLFVSQNGHALARTILGRHIAHIGQRAGVVPCYPHLFRHTFAIMYLRAGGDPYSLQYLLGHSDMTVTRMYVKIAAVNVGEMYRSPVDRLRL